MKLLIIDTEGLGLALAWRSVQAGHQVRWFVKPDDLNPPIGEGFKGIEKVANWVPSMQWADLAFCTGNDGYLKRLDFFRKQGKKVFAPSAASADLEIKRGLGMEFLEKHGIHVPEYETFKNLADAEKHVKKTGERYVFKTLGDNEDKSLSYVGRDAADMVSRLQRWQKTGMNPKGPVMLQQFIPGIEFAVSRWMGSEGFIGHYNENFEHKKVCSGDVGPNCGEAGTVQKYVEKSELGKEMLDPLEKSLVELGHLGDVDVNCIVDDNGQAWPLEFTMRPGWPAFNIMMAEHKGDPVQWMLDACNGKDTTEQSLDHAVGIVIGHREYPREPSDKKELDLASGLPIYGIDKRVSKYVQPQYVKTAVMPQMDGEAIVEKEMWVTSGNYLMVVTGTGKNVSQACKRAYDTVDKIKVADMTYRDDIGEKLEKQIPELQAFGYGMEFDY